MEKGISNNVINDFIQYLKQTCMDIFTRYIDFRLKLSELNLEEVDNGFTDEVNFYIYKNLYNVKYIYIYILIKK